MKKLAVDRPPVFSFFDQADFGLFVIFTYLKRAMI